MLSEQQQEQIIDHVVQGASWLKASEASGVSLERMLEAVVNGRRLDGCPTCQAFVRRLESAGKLATEASLRQHRKAVNHA